MQREQHQDHSGNFPQSWAKNAKVFILAAVFVLICFGFGCGESVEKVNLPPGRPDAQLLTYTSKGDLRAVKYLIVKLKADPNAMVVSSSGDSALHIAVEKNYSDIVLYLLKKKANVNAKNSLGETPLAIAVQQNNLELAQILLKSKAKVNVESSFGRVFMQCQNKTGWHTLYENRLKRLNQNNGSQDYLIHTVVIQNNLEALKLLLKYKADVKVKGIADETPLHWAAYNGNKEMIALLKKKGADLNAVDCAGNSPLIYCVIGNQPETMEYLLSSGAKISPAHLQALLEQAVESRNEKLVRRWVEAGAKPTAAVLENLLKHNEADTMKELLPAINLKSVEGAELLNSALGWKRNAIVDLLLDVGVQVTGTKGNILLWPIVNQNIKAVQRLLEAGADVNAADEDKFTALMMASRDNRLEAVKLLIAAGANVNAKNKDNETALSYAVASAVDKNYNTYYGADPAVSKKAIVKALIDAGADPTIKNKSGESIMELAQRIHVPQDIFRMLVPKGKIDKKLVPQLFQQALDSNDTEMLTRLLEQKVEIPEDTFFKIAISGNMSQLRTLTESGFKVDSDHYLKSFEQKIKTETEKNPPTIFISVASYNAVKKFLTPVQ